jgi:hypothetical protein
MSTCQEVLNFFEESIKHKDQIYQDKPQTFISVRSNNEKDSQSQPHSKEQENIDYLSYVPTLKPKNSSIHTSSFSLESTDSVSPVKDRHLKTKNDQPLVTDKGKRTVLLKVNLSKFAKTKN